MGFEDQDYMMVQYKQIRDETYYPGSGSTNMLSHQAFSGLFLHCSEDRITRMIYFQCKVSAERGDYASALLWKFVCHRIQKHDFHFERMTVVRHKQID